jgi:formylmethanofuran dehydrogenase subunit D
MEEKYSVIGISGKKFSGKNTLADHLTKNYGYEQIAYADPLKEIGKIFGFTNEQLYGSKKEEVDNFWETSSRNFLQKVGTDLFRNHSNIISPKMGQDVWINIVKKKIQEHPNKCFVITDVRFPNEAQLVKDLGGIVIKLQRDSDYIDNHPSEALIDSLPSDYQFENNGSKEELYTNVIKELGFPILQTFETGFIRKRRGSKFMPHDNHDNILDEPLIDSTTSPATKSLGDEIKETINEFKIHQDE